jgi:prepilin-type N-terminal cleavage/methylation domain-containing protein
VEYLHKKSLKNNASNNEGFTIIEALMAIAIFSIGIMAVGSLQTSSLMSTGDIAQKTEAWTILDRYVETFKNLPFYANKDGIDNDGDGTTDEIDEERSELVAGSQSEDNPDGRFTVHWQVVDDSPIQGAGGSKLNVPGDAVLKDVPAGDYTVSKTISVQVTRAGGDPDTEALAMVEFVKTWAGQAGGIP